ncbi:Clavaminate synthase-like protein [Aureobasidium subglaciale]|uniref:JmjC domain-containing protein n=1 Tax=Aureobasidium subglaciale (strain EXF-2481) TaxID=1043005 RepID=A0A074ZM85_AURSE|nr:uncharacterized protein AUEXF2481DRAFT_35406 [Aureobasidium subglaciale EXF-2481]KAI5206210.1 Clavaminate synthase-like protein [Aureobasidium subglaciale]KAI5225043.1 Clavaminate synthase-like protein [Aureobasidium subglaciale]KAI5228627.1 Clavaminate synthase-like protein [Aureobasidium subglaciale]KAI5253711.1 Clavaminate synthase-like protein [Aureobasidium subglaciale]KAI5263682.1 Clavaminate synthase-like protein [Aureobasidium subglaciale]
MLERVGFSRSCLLRQSRAYSTTSSSLRDVPILQDASLTTFRNHAFTPAVPSLLPRGAFCSIPATKRWFKESLERESQPGLDTIYLKKWGSTIVPLEITNEGGQFTQVHQPLQFFLDASELETKASVYLAQASLSDLPSSLSEDLPTPELVSKAGRGDIYDTSIWLGHAPTYTPLHRDPNPNLFVQLAGKKQVRLFKPDMGNAIFHHVQITIGGAANATIRGAEMMEGAERKALEQAVWSPSSAAFWSSEGLQCEVGPGDALFIPKGWWHSIKGVGQGMIGSVNWWFR